MCVVPLVAGGNNPTVVEAIEAFHAAGGLGGEAVLIQGLDLGQLNSPNDSNVSYDLRVGGEYRDHRNPGRNDLPEGGEIILHPGAAVIVQTEELVHFPRTRFGLIVPKVTLLQRGLSNTLSKVDPGYMGHLLVTVFNLGKTTVRLHRRDPFCSLSVLEVHQGARPYNKGPKQIAGQAREGTWQRVRDWLERNSAAVSVLVIIVTLCLVIVQILSFVFNTQR